MPKSFPLLTVAAAALITALAATPAKAAPFLAWASPIAAPIAQAAPTPEAEASKTALTRIFLAAGATLRGTDTQTDALFFALEDGSGASVFAADDLAAPTTLALSDAGFAMLETGPAEAPTPVTPVMAALEAAQRPEDLVLADAGDGLQVVSLDELENYAGGTGINLGVFTNPVLTGVTNGNSVTGVDVTSGGITIETDAFSGYDGIGNFVINSGHNNVLQSTVNVSIVMTPQ